MTTTRGWNERRVFEELRRAYGAAWKVNAFYDHGCRLFFAGMFLTQTDEQHETPMGAVAATPPWLRAQRIFGWGKDWEEACHFLKLGRPLTDMPQYECAFNRKGHLVRLVDPKTRLVVPFDRPSVIATA